MDPLTTIILALVVAYLAYLAYKAITNLVANWRAPVLRRHARVLAKREEVRTTGGLDRHGATVSTDYYATFEFDDGHREEFSLSGQEYGTLVEGDTGTLATEGQWFFELHPDGRA